jgi:GNAT superfamily N-acetyltransferase
VPRKPPRFETRPLTTETWSDFVKLFGPRGACGGCWCMTPRVTRAVYERDKGAGNRAAMQRLVRRGPPPGILGYLDGEPIAWCSIEPRECFSALGRSRILAPVDDEPVWSITCLFVQKDHRRRGVSTTMLEHAVRWATRQGARIVEGYPVEPRQDPTPPVFAYTGIASAFRRAGFVEVVRRSATRPILRRVVERRRIVKRGGA